LCCVGAWGVELWAGYGGMGATSQLARAFFAKPAEAFASMLPCVPKTCRQRGRPGRGGRLREPKRPAPPSALAPPPRACLTRLRLRFTREPQRQRASFLSGAGRVSAWG
jgi:hypothetical protein